MKYKPCFQEKLIKIWTKIKINRVLLLLLKADGLYYWDHSYVFRVPSFAKIMFPAVMESHSVNSVFLQISFQCLRIFQQILIQYSKKKLKTKKTKKQQQKKKWKEKNAEVEINIFFSFSFYLLSEKTPDSRLEVIFQST